MRGMACQCASSPDSFEVWPDDVEAFSGRVTLHEESRGVGLYQCPSCHQWWYFDSLSRSNLAVKLPNKEAWGRVDAETHRMRIWTDQQGGIGSDTCRWRGCDNPAIRDRAFCPEHFFKRDFS
jgi:hypothetical protein